MSFIMVCLLFMKRFVYECAAAYACMLRTYAAYARTKHGPINKMFHWICFTILLWFCYIPGTAVPFQMHWFCCAKPVWFRYIPGRAAYEIDYWLCYSYMVWFCYIISTFTRNMLVWFCLLVHAWFRHATGNFHANDLFDSDLYLLPDSDMRLVF
jgi:hypothetical protein